MKLEIKERIEKIKRGEVPEGYKKTKAGVSPFEWNVCKAKKLFKNYTNKNHNGDLEVLSVTQDRGVIPRSHLDIDIKYDKSSLTNYKKVDYGDFVISLRSFQGGIEYSEYEGLVSPAYTVLKEKRKIHKGYYKQLFKTNRFISRLNSIIYGIRDGKQISYKDFSELYLFEPSLAEQQKIANILYAWDKAIELKEKLIEEKKKQKKGLMQLLLTGKKRLPGFKGEWKEVRFGREGTTFNGLNGKTASDFGTGKPYIPYKNVFSNSKIDISYVDYVNISDEENQTKVRYGDIFFTTSSETPEEVAISSVLLDDVKEMYLNSFCFGFRLNNFKRMLPEFLRFYLRSDAFRRKIYRLAQGSTRFNISKNEIMKIKINIPEVNEQRAISRVLEVCEKQIQLLEQELEALKLQKKGLMKLLLTGIVRVKDSE